MPTTHTTDTARDALVIVLGDHDGLELHLPDGADEADPIEHRDDDLALAPPRRHRSTRRFLWQTLNVAGLLVVIAGALLLLVPHLLGYDRYVIVGGSMEPTVERGSVIFSEDIPVGDLAVGDVITYQPPPDSGVHRLVTHRIVDITAAEDGTPVFQTQGDANASPDPWHFQLEEQHQNVMRFDVPLIGHGLLALADPRLRTIIIGVPAALIALGAALELVGLQVRVPRPRGAVR